MCMVERFVNTSLLCASNMHAQERLGSGIIRRVMDLCESLKYRFGRVCGILLWCLWVIYNEHAIEVIDLMLYDM